MVAEQEKKAIKSHEQATDIEQFGEIAHERREMMRSQLERAEKQHNKDHSEQEILAEATELAKKADAAKETKTATTSPAERRRGPISKKQLDTSFKSQMTHVQNEMNASNKLISKFIHSRPVETTSDFIGSTFARPNALLSGSIAAFISITVLYFVAKYYGFRLSGFETIAAFVLGWVFGILYDYFSVMIRGRKH